VKEAPPAPVVVDYGDLVDLVTVDIRVGEFLEVWKV
jgi:hypothetical protein